MVQNDLFFIVINGGAGGSWSGGAFDQLAQDAIVTLGSQMYQISYTADFATQSMTGGNDIALMAVPEPGTGLMLLSGLGMLLLARRSRVRA